MKVVSKEVRDEMIKLGFLVVEKGRLKDALTANRTHPKAKTLYVCEANYDRYMNFISEK